ncbi:hypothetical protein N2152v2_006040 [Parachlorella kessleri]
MLQQDEWPGFLFVLACQSKQQRHLSRQEVVQLNLKVSITSSLSSVGKDEWDQCAAAEDVNPFLLHDFLEALEVSKSAVKEEGWLPQHVLVRQEETGELLGCCPMYLKGHSYGEYVFDSAWANTYNRFLGQDYYPKLQCCVPFTPVTGHRLLVKPGPWAAAVRKAMAETLQQIADQLGVSSLHVTFCTEQEWEHMGAEQGYLQRAGIQYWWVNKGYSSFDDYLMHLRQSKRKNIRQERKRATADSDLRIRQLTGADIKPHHWDAFYSFYLNTSDRKWGTPYLTRDFFHQLGERMADRVLLVVAESKAGMFGQGEVVAGALNLIGSNTLYGRNWGCKYGDAFKNLHFELCYYQALDYAITHKLERVEAGAQGEHKIQRGYLPHLTFSSHYIPNPHFRGIVDRYLQQERAEIAYTLQMLRQEVSPYKDDPC